MNLLNLRSYHVQEHRHVNLPIFNVDRVDYPSLLDSLHYPVIWVHDGFLGAWIPAEVDHAFLNWVKTLPFTFDADNLPKGRLLQLYRFGLLGPVRNTVEQLKEVMNTYGHVKIMNLLHHEYCKTMLKGYYWRNDHQHDRWKDMEGIKRTSCNNMPLMRLIHQATQQLVSDLIGESFKTSYSFTSAYESGTCLPAHTDRPQCVYNISFMLGSDPPNMNLTNWPLYIQNAGVTHRVDLDVGDAVLYSGTRDLHWRDYMPVEIQSTLGVFFHYVPQSYEGSLD